MTTKQHVDYAREQLENARESTMLAHESWCLFLKSHKNLLTSHEHLGSPSTQIVEDFEKLISENAKRYKTLLESMNQLEKIQMDLIHKLGEREIKNSMKSD